MNYLETAPSIADFADNEFFNGTSAFSAPSPMRGPDKAELEALKSYAEASIRKQVKLTQYLLPENISRYMNDAGVVESMNYFWSGSSSR